MDLDVPYHSMNMFIRKTRRKEIVSTSVAATLWLHLSVAEYSGILFATMNEVERLAVKIWHGMKLVTVESGLVCLREVLMRDVHEFCEYLDEQHPPAPAEVCYYKPFADPFPSKFLPPVLPESII